MWVSVVEVYDAYGEWVPWADNDMTEVVIVEVAVFHPGAVDSDKGLHRPSTG